MKSWKKPTPELVKNAIARMLRLEQQHYFFERLENPEWIEPLRGEGFFRQPPPERQEGTGTTFFLWPASRFLARMARLTPDLVADIMAPFPKTRNPFILQDILDAALAMPSASAARLAAALSRSLPYSTTVGTSPVGELAVRLAEGAESAAALTILRSALQVVPDPRPAIVGFSGHVYRNEALTAIHSYDYEAILRENGERLVASLGAAYLELLSKKLVFALKQECPEYRKIKRPIEDYSYIWSPDLGSDHLRGGAKHLLVPAILQATENMFATGKWKEAQSILERQPFIVFQRIQLAVLLKYSNSDVELTERKLSNPLLFNAYGAHQEYDQLLRIVFPKMSFDQQKTILALIDAGPDLTYAREHGVAEERIQEQTRRWKLERYEPIRQSLPPTLVPQVELLEKELGKTTSFKNPTVQGGAIPLGGSSPASSTQLQAMPADEVFRYLRTWSTPADSPFGPSYQGLAHEFEAVVQSAPEQFLQRLEGFRNLPPTYVRAAFQGFRGAAKSGVALAWRPLLELAQWICKQPEPLEQAGQEENWFGHDSNWRPTRFAIIDVLQDAINSGSLPVELADLAWELINTISNDESGCLDYDDPTTLEKDVWSYSLNTLRPRAVRTGFGYMRWRMNSLRAEGKTIEDAAEILAYLDKHLDPTKEKSLSVRLIYGEHLLLLHFSAPRWTSRSLPLIFPDTPELQPLRDVAWGAYLAANRAALDMVRLLEPQYRQAIRIPDACRALGKGHMMDRPSNLLARHLVQLYWWGLIDLSSSSSLLAEFIEGADDEALRSAIVYVGKSLAESHPVDPKVIKRLEVLWDHILQSERSKKPNEVFTGFGWWFNTSCFEDRWALDHLERSLSLARGKYEPLLGALDRLSRLAEMNPRVVVNCAKAIVLGADQYMTLWPIELRHILEVGLNSGDALAASAATQLINELGRRGNHSFRNLLRATDPKWDARL